MTQEQDKALDVRRVEGFESTGGYPHSSTHKTQSTGDDGQNAKTELADPLEVLWSAPREAPPPVEALAPPLSDAERERLVAALGCIKCGEPTNRRSGTGHPVCDRCANLVASDKIHPDGVHFVRASSVSPESVEYLDEGLIPLRVVTLVTGLDGVGKSTILYTKAARATRGTLAGALMGAPVDVVIASSEDHPATVIVPRLIAAGADLERCHIVKVNREGIEGEIVLPDDLEEMAYAVADVSARLLIVDPLVAYMPLQVDSHKAQHVRSVMAPLARLAEDERLAVAAVVHFNGSPSTDVRSRISGSKALRDAARSVLVCGEDPEDESRFVLAQDKFSFGPKPSTGRAYRIEAAEITHKGNTYATSRVVWLGEVPISARSMLAGPTDSEERSDREIAREIILDALAEADHQWQGDLLKLTKAEGVTDRTARRARDDLKKEGMIDRRKAGPHWWWTLKSNLSTHRGQVDGGQVEKHALTGGNTPPDVQLVQPLESGQVGQVDPLEDAQRVVESVFGAVVDFLCDRCEREATAYTPEGMPVCDDCAAEVTT